LLKIFPWWLMMVHSPCWHYHLSEIRNSCISSYLNATQNGANELCLDARKKLSTLDIQRSCLDLRDCLCCDDDNSWVSFYNTFWAKHGVCHPPRVKLWMHSLHWQVEE
jgi:hypothetical protein